MSALRSLTPVSVQSRPGASKRFRRTTSRSAVLLLATGLALGVGGGLTGCAVPAPATPTIAQQEGASGHPGSATAMPQRGAATGENERLPTPGSTVEPLADAIADLPASPRVLLVGTGRDQPALRAALDGVIARTGGDLTVLDLAAVAADAHEAELALSAALNNHPDLVITLGEAEIDPIDRVSSTHLDQRFVLIGAQLPEPTDNVTAIIWPGASARGLSPETIPLPDPNERPETAAARFAERALVEGFAVAGTGHTGFVTALRN
ncbi:hypothetical protein D9V32_13950 [Mycetocola tolaasinivorans]|uniref:BMP family ABC transporter substrate-binding protein n=1 Tax=Mycetocola tolaasinivorans TaxID=76635 RepID=A0A3L7A296_9MICO|nr:hypothetical protein [Mycetocola tolaasinivorans]RLP74140.1 hypothetical protein D9V32_13950 [Mycetocola tolaasinivorans]